MWSYSDSIYIDVKCTSTPEQDRMAGRRDDRERRQQMTSPSERRQRSHGQLRAPAQPVFQTNDNRDLDADHNNGFQLQPPFQYNMNYGHGEQLNGGYNYQVNWQQPGYAWNNPARERDHPQPIAGPSRGADPGRDSWDIENIMARTNAMHAERVRNRARGHRQNHEGEQNLGANTGSRYHEMAAERARRAQEIAEQQRIEQEAHAAAETWRRQQQRAQFEAEMEALAAAAAQRRAAEEEAEHLEHMAAQQLYEQRRALEEQRRAEEQAQLDAARAAQRLYEQQQRDLPPGRRDYREPITKHYLGAMNVVCRHCNALHWFDESLSGSSRINPKFGVCCLQGQVALPLPSLPPQPLRDLMNGAHPRYRHFQDNIRRYNLALAFTSTGVNTREHLTSGPYSFILHGEMMHQIGSLLPGENRSPVYAQLYIHDSQMANDARRRNSVLSGLDYNIMSELHDLMVRENPLVQVYRMAYEQPPDQRTVVRARIVLQATEDPRRYNLPTADEIAAIIPGSGENENVDKHRQIALRLQGGGLEHMSHLNPLEAPLHYVLLFPRGEQGWHLNIPSNVGPNGRVRAGMVTERCYYAYVLHPRYIEGNEIHYLFRGGRLFQQYIVDAWASIESSLLYWVRTHQKDIRADLYRGLLDALRTSDHNQEVDLSEQGHKVILPATHPGSSRHMYQLFQDSMAICRRYRKPDIFLTMTANPKWPEVEEALLELAGGDHTRKQTAAERPDIVARVFHLKKKALLKMIKDGFFGGLAADVYTIEFQKRGLPHMHLLIFLREPDKIRDAAMVDSIVSARLPDPVTQPALYSTVTRMMLHGPCDARCKSDSGSCNKRYPRDYCEETQLSEDGYPVYARPNDGRQFVNAKGDVFTNRDVVPHNPLLTAMFDCHINVEICASVKAVKYIHKYIYKGHDRATMEVQQDEIKQYIDARYIGTPEAMWHIMEFAMHEERPTVYRLPVHLEDEQMVYFDPEDIAEEVAQRAQHKKTQLTEWFTANEKHPELANQVLYQDFPEKFVWNKRTREWTPRQRDFAIGRMHFVHPSAGERFYLRLLLTVVKGAKSWDDLLLYNGEHYFTFKAACVARGLLEDDGEWRQCLSEAAIMQSGKQLRDLFAIILLFEFPTDPLGLWNSFKEYLCDDLQHRLTTVMGYRDPTEEQIYDLGLYLINETLIRSGKSLRNYPPMPLPQLPWGAGLDNPLLHEELDYDVASLQNQVDSNRQHFNDEQSAAFDNVMDSVTHNKGRVFFLHSAGGCGKTYVCNTIAAAVRASHHVALTVASSGIAALLLVGGRTAHSRFKIPIPAHSDSICNIRNDSDLAAMLRQTRIIIWDEVPMQHRFAIEAVDRTLRDLLKSNRPFGGVTVLFGGDFRQTLPVVPHGSRSHIVGATLCRSPLWTNVAMLHLTQNMRLEQSPENAQFAEWLLKVGSGSNSAPDGQIELPRAMALPSNSVDSLISELYPDIAVPNKPDQYFLERTILSAKNDAVDDLNQSILDMFPGEEHIMQSADKVKGDDHQHYPIEFLNSIKASGLPLARLVLKVGCPLMLLRNLDPRNGLCNGTRMILLEIQSRVLRCRILGGDHAGREVYIPRITLEPSGEDIPVPLCRRQFPVRLAFAMTINKSQGQSVTHVGLDLRTAVFAHGQLYVALSRCTSPSRIKVMFAEEQEDMRTMNIVYQEVLPNL